jgi:hypothetical protein
MEPTTIEFNQPQTSPVRATLRLWPDTGRLLGLGRLATYQGAARGDIPTIRVGRRILVPKIALQRMLENPRTRSAWSGQQ